MKKLKQILALLGVFFLVGLYVLTLVSAFTDDPDSMHYFAAALLATVIIPTLLWAYSFIYRLLAQSRREREDDAALFSSADSPDDNAGSQQEEGNDDRKPKS